MIRYEILFCVNMYILASPCSKRRFIDVFMEMTPILASLLHENLGMPVVFVGWNDLVTECKSQIRLLLTLLHNFSPMDRFNLLNLAVRCIRVGWDGHVYVVSNLISKFDNCC